MYVTIDISLNQRIIVYPEGGLDLEAYVPIIGWVNDNNADIPDHVVQSYINRAREILSKVNLTGSIA